MKPTQALGLGINKLTKDGSVLSRTIFDKSVFSPERLIFEASPTLEKGLSQKKYEIYYNKGIPLNVSKMEDNILN